jgi:hypothetical protein
LDRDGAAHGIDGAGELDQDSVPHDVHDAAAVRADCGVDQLPSQGAQPRQSAFFVIADEPAVAGDVGG